MFEHLNTPIDLAEIILYTTIDVGGNSLHSSFCGFVKQSLRCTILHLNEFCHCKTLRSHMRFQFQIISSERRFFSMHNLPMPFKTVAMHILYAIIAFELV